MSRPIYVKNCTAEHLNGIYYPKKSPSSVVDGATTFYQKDATHQIYRYKREWRIAHLGKKVHRMLMKDECLSISHNIIDFQNTSNRFKFDEDDADNQPKINFGVLIYSNRYNNLSSFNIGDWVQSLAALNIYKKVVEAMLGVEYDFEDFIEKAVANTIPKFRFVFIKRDNMDEMDQYRGLSNIITIMNGWWMHPVDRKGSIVFTVPPCVVPIFISFHIANGKLLDSNSITIFKQYEPIGCRDQKTADKLRNKGVKAYFSGCLTTTIDFLKWNKREDRVYLVDTKINKDDIEMGIGLRYQDYVSKKKNVNYPVHYPNPSRTQIVKVSHCRSEYKNTGERGLKMAYDLLKQYSESDGVFTSRLHGYLPCLAMGVPVDLISPDGRRDLKTWCSPDRFEGLRELNNPESLLVVRNNLTKLAISNIIDRVNAHVMYNIGAYNKQYTPMSDMIIRGYNDVDSLSKPREISICFCSDSNLVNHIPTVLESIRVKNHHHTLKIYYIHNIQDRSKLRRLQAYVNLHDNMTLYSSYQSWDHEYKGLSHVTPATMLRLFIPDKIREKKVIYLDIDIVVNTDLSTLLDIDTGSRGLAIKSSLSSNWKRIGQTSKAGNVGVMVMDLDTLRRLKFTQDCLKIHKIHNQHDQWVINNWARGNYAELPENYNVFFRQDEWILDQYHDYILHYAGNQKPYNRATGDRQYMWNIHMP
jgi:lipopolysaccharide biosynthesis glycosyltransferase